MEKVVNELRVIETDDGFRIEIKGDKEQIKAFMSGFGKHKHGPGRPPRPGRGHWGPHAIGPWMWMKAACHGMWDFEVEEDEAEEVAKA